MLKRSRIVIIMSITISLLFSLIFFAFYPRNLKANKIFIAAGESGTFTGDYEGDLSIMYIHDASNYSSWSYENSSTNIIPYNYTDFYDNEYKLESVDIRAVNLENPNAIGNYTIAENTSSPVNLPNAYAFAQEFTAPELLRINNISIYVDFILLRPCYFDIFIYDENLEDKYLINDYIDWGWVYENRFIVNEWLSIPLDTPVLEPGEKYNIVLKVWFIPGAYNETFNYWKVEEYLNSNPDKGLTRFFDGIRWHPIYLDNRRDMLCKFSYTEFIHPSEIDLKYSINNQTIVPNYQEDGAFLTYHLEEEPSQNMNITVFSNQTIPKLDVEIRIYYTFLIEATGSYLVDENQIEWTIKYPFEDISMMWPPPVFFLFEKDWTFVEFKDPDENVMNEVYFGSKQLYNESFFGITVIFTPLERGIYTGTFFSPNYCHSILSNIKTESDYIFSPSIQLGQVIQLEAVIENVYNEPISGGIGQLTLKSPSGVIIYNGTGLTSINGTLSSSDIEIGSNFETGNYEAEVFWTNGREIAFFKANIIVVAPVNILFWVLLSVGIAIISVSSALVARKYIRQRNWEKSLKNLFVLTKDGLSLYEYSFGVEIQDPALISAMISALTNFVREATGSKKSLRTIDQEDKKVILYHGNHTITALTSEKDLPIIHKRIKKFSETFEQEFGIQLKKWTGETSVFKGAEVIVNKNFPIDVEDQIIRGVRGKLVEFRYKLETMIKPRDIISLMREITEFISRYRAIVNQYYIDYYFEIIKTAEEKISST
ncbi:MAG: hypothetical protein JSV62_05295 [Promethearchaeota archaeon]|nr:MAG: hypothetical protein JSV62_05295 [Candidatus Lokiarchaeota archaeon]